jgi:hypothetical protein
VPYTPRRSGRFRVHQTELIAWPEWTDLDVPAAFRAFHAGVEANAEGARVWYAALGERV